MTKKIYPFIVVFIVTTILLWGVKYFMASLDYDRPFTLIANLLIFIMTIAGYLIVSGKTGQQIHGFMRGVFMSFLLKMVVIIGALFIFMIVSKNINKPALFISMGLYIIYTSFEVSLLMKRIRNHKNE